MQSAVDDMCAELVNIEAEELAAAAVEGKGIIAASKQLFVGTHHR